MVHPSQYFYIFGLSSSDEIYFVDAPPIRFIAYAIKQRSTKITIPNTIELFVPRLNTTKSALPKDTDGVDVAKTTAAAYWTEDVDSTVVVVGASTTGAAGVVGFVTGAGVVTVVGVGDVTGLAAIATETVGILPEIRFALEAS